MSNKKYKIYMVFAVLLAISASAQNILREKAIDIAVNESSNKTIELGEEAEVASIGISGSVSQNGTARVYVEQEGEKKLVFDSNRALFDVNVMVLPEYKSVLPGSEILIDVSVFNLRGFGKTDAAVKYSIKNDLGKSLGFKTENITIETKAKFVRNLMIPEDIIPGKYVAYVSVNVKDNSLGSSSDSFEVKKPEKEEKPKGGNYVLNASLIAMLLIAVSIIIMYWILKKGKSESPEQAKAKIGSLNKKLKSLEKAHEIGAVSKESYEKSRMAIEEQIKSLEKK